MFLSKGSTRSGFQVFLEGERPRILSERDVALDAPPPILSSMCQRAVVVRRKPFLHIVSDSSIAPGVSSAFRKGENETENIFEIERVFFL